jgi:hypothetical protein
MLNIDTHELMEKEMNRKQFLRNIGIGVVAFTGVAAALKAISQVSTHGNDELQSGAGAKAANAASAYGGSVYGGTKPQA